MIAGCNPVVSVVVANYNGARHLAIALRSILAQSLKDLEVLFVDDASTDRSIEIAEALAANDARLRILRLPMNCGPAAARNAALACATGSWIAVVDSDDFIHPARLRRLVDAAEVAQADIIADDMLAFDDDHRTPPRRMLQGALGAAPSWVTPEQFVRCNRLFAATPPLGYLKPLIRASLLTSHRIAYNVEMQIAEDYDLILRLLARGARFRLLPELLYFYRRHAASISHRLSPSTLAGMVAADARFRSWAGEATVAPLRAALDERLASVAVATAAEMAIANLKARRPLAAVGGLLKQPAAVPIVARPIVARLASPRWLTARFPRRKTRDIGGAMTEARRPTIAVLSRQRLTLGSSGSSAYLLSLCGALRDSGFALRLVCPSPSVLGRVPFLRVAGDQTVFDRVAIRGTSRIGGWFVAREPAVFVHAAIGVADRLARRFGITMLSRFAKPAPYAVGMPWSAEDFLFVAAETRGEADIVLADYGFLTPGIPYALRPGATSAVVMHDLFSSRPAVFASLGATDSVATLDEAAEAGLLAGADLVIAIQSEEAAAARRILPAGRAVVVAPMAIDPVAEPQAGEGGGLLFVGSSTAPNVDGLRWFLAEVWPHIRAQRPEVELIVAGTVCGAVADAVNAPGVVLLGRVAELAPLYRRADVVISPLRAGSGLKIKLIEALGHGKPVVATTVTAQGVEHLVRDAVALADQPQDFAAKVMHLLAQPKERAAQAEAALASARRNFSVGTAYAAAIDHLRARHAAAAVPI